MSDWYVDTHIDIARVYRKKRINTHRCFIMSMMYTRNLVDLHLKYYTDFHDVDENDITIPIYGGYWCDKTVGGVASRGTAFNPTNTFDAVVSRCRHLKNDHLLYG